jgi:hypothetical protein
MTMARESRRKREARRFGSPERLVDILLGTPPRRWKLTPALHASASRGAMRLEDMIRGVEKLQADVAAAAVVSADNVCAYYFDHPKCEWDFGEDFPCCRPPMDDILIEFRTPPKIRVEGGVEQSTAGMYDVGGCLFHVTEAETLRRMMPVPDRAAPGGLAAKEIPDAAWFVQCAMLGASGGFPLLCGASRYFAIDGAGRILEGPHTIVQGDIGALHCDPSDIGSAYDILLIPALLAVSFMHCKNVTLDAVEPDARLNRERERAGLKPFVRYHTINIEPMKAVLRTEGGIETNGLKKALHIVRGHFATYSEERPLFGRSGLHGRFWMPSHVRGSVKQGVVVSDYAVGAPQ